MTGHQTVKSFKKSSVPGVVITQFVDEIPKGCSTPDFEKKPITLTLQEGKNAIFRAVVKGVPTPEVKWTRTQGGMDDPDKYQAFFNNATNEFILQINKPTVNDSDLYRCLAVNEYGEAACSAGLRIIQVGFKRKTKYVPVHPAEELKKNLQDFRKLLRKRAPVQKPKPLDMEAVWQLLLHADRRDYEKICIKYGIVDFRGMLRKLQEIKKDTESEQGELIHSIKNFEHIKVNKDGKASFSLEMDLKNSKSKVYLLKDGEKLRYGTGDEYRKHCLRRIGKRYNFIVNDVQPEDAGVYQVRVEDVPVFSTELEAESIPVRFEQPLSDIRCPEEENAVFECVLRTPCYDAVWLHKTHLLEASEKHQISVTPDGLTHRLVIKNVVPSDNGMYTLDTGLCSSNAWLIVEYAKGKRRQGEGGEREKPEQLKETLPDKERAKKPRHREYVDNEDHLIDTGMEKNGWYRNGQDGSQGHSVDVDGSHHRFLGKDGLREVHKNERMGSGQFSRAGLDGDSMTNDDSSFELSILGSKSRLRPIQGKDSPAGRADTGHEFGRAGEGYPVDGRDDDMLGAVVDGGEGVGGQLDKDGRLGDSYRAGFGGGGRLDATDGSSRLDGLNPDSTRVGGGKGDLFSRNSLGTGTRKNAAGTKTAGGMRSPHGKDGPPTAVDMNGASINREGQTGSPYGKDSLALHASGHLDQAGRSGLLYGPGHLPAGDGAICGEGGSSIGKMAALYGPDGQPVGAGIYDTGVAGAGAFGSPCGKDGFLAGSGLGGAGIAGAGGIGSSYGQDGLPAGGGVGGATVGFGGIGTPYGKDGLPAGTGNGGATAGSFEGLGTQYRKDGFPAGADIDGAGATNTGSVGSPFGKDGLPVGTGIAGAGIGDAVGLGSPYGTDGLPDGATAGGAGVAGAGGVGSPYGNDSLLARAGPGIVGVGSPYGKDGLPARAGVGGAGVVGEGGVGSPYGKDGHPLAGAGIGGAGVGGARGVGSPYGKDGLPAGAGIGDAGVGGSGGVGSPYGKDGLPAGAGVGGAGVGGAGGVWSPYGKDGVPAGTVVADAGVGGAGGVGSPYGKDGLPVGAGIVGAGVGGAGGVGSPYGKDSLPAGTVVGGAGVGGAGGVGSLYGKDGLPAGAGVAGAGVGGAGGVGSPYGKDGLPAGTVVAGVGGAGGVGSPYGKDGLPAGAGAGLAGVGSPYGRDGLPARAGVGGAGVGGAGGVGSPYGKDGLPAGAGVCGAGVGGAGGVGSPYGKDGLPAGAGVAGAGVGGAGGFGSPSGKDGLPAGAGVGAAGVGGAGGVGSPYGKDGLPAGAGVCGAGVGGAGGVGSPYGKDGLPAGAGVAGAGVGGAGGFGSPYGKDGLPAGAGAGLVGAGSPCGRDGLPAGAGVGGAGVGGTGVRSPYGKDGLPAGASVGGAAVGGYGGAASPYGEGVLPAGVVAGAVQFPFVGKEGMGSHHGRNAMLSRAQGYLGGAGGGDSSSEVSGMGGSAARSVRSPYSKDSGSAGARAGVDGDGRELLSIHGGEVVLGAVGRGGEYGLDSHPGKSSVGGETAKGTASAFRGSGISGSPHDRDSLSGQRDAGGKGGDLGQLGSHYGKNSALGGAGSTSHDSSVTGSSSAFGQGSLRYGQMADLYGGPPSINHRKPELELDLKENDFLKNTESLGNKRRYCLDDLKAPRCHLNKQLLGVRVLKGEPAELSCTVSKEDVMGTWFKDGLKLKSMDGVVFEKEGLVHKLIINKVEDIHAGKYRFEGGDIKTEASIFVEDPPQVDKVLLKNLTSVPTVAKAGQKVQIKIPFEGRLPVRAMWLKDKMELIDDTRIRVDNTETFTMLSIASSERKDCGDYKVRLKNDSGVLEINLKLLVLDKPQPPAGPIKIVQSSINDITIQWKPPKDDGGKPLQRYIVERQQVGKSDWVTLGETPKTCTTFTTNKVEQDMSYYFRVRAVNAEGTSDPLESDEVKAVGKASPGAPDAPEIVSTSKDSITISWKAPRKTGSSRIVGYIVQKRKKGTMTWLPVNNAPVSDKKLKITNLKKGLQYEFRVAAVNGAGIGDASGPSQPAFARDCTKTLGPVQDLKVSSSDSSSVTLTWKTPETKNGSDVKGYEVELRPSTSLNWTKCTTLPLEMTTYTVKGLQAKEKYFLRVRALNDSGPGEATEVEAHMEAAPPVVSPRFLIDDTVKSFLLVKAGDTIRVNIPFEASPDPVVTWLKDGQLLPNQAAITTKDGTTQLLIGAAEFTDTGTYTIKLQNGLGKRETFSFQVQVTDIPQPPGPIHLEENVPNTVTVTWEPSASERWESHLYYTVLKRESEKGLWHVVGDLIYNNKFTFTQLIPGRDYYFKVVAKNCLGASSPSETVKPWRIQKTKAESKVKPQQYRGVNQSQPPRILVPLKPHVVTTGSECHMSCAVAGHPSPKITWYKDSRDLSSDPAYLCTNDFGVCSLVILGVTAQDEGEYMVEASNEMGRAFSKAFLTIKDSTL
ncbi:immunoglobulin-like and fibronectin type III domain-containing protein 1 isoform X25 [Phaenicophaeus curvirostris]|uniref:immunoglobulin-like and fibronectin type III domain-containing protein 1 isoform X25 n=1 Tax=Phaenicophaeus curvirostris TaxID=33595 RepID=UPI0037F0BC83